MADGIEMDRLITELESETLKVTKELSNLSYEEIERFVDRRQGIVNELIGLAEIATPSVVQNERVLDVLKNDDVIMSRMNLLRLEAQDSIRQCNQAKAQRNAYEGYGGPMDSILMDRKN